MTREQWDDLCEDIALDAQRLFDLGKPMGNFAPLSRIIDLLNEVRVGWGLPPADTSAMPYYYPPIESRPVTIH